jgi:regulator of sigma E protease
MPFLALALPSLMHVLAILALVFGFGFVIFFHELGHFLAAKAVGIKVEQFAVGFGQAVFSWRKGIGVRLGNTQKEYHRRIEEYVAKKHKDDPQFAEKTGPAYQQASIEAEKSLGLGETEYRLNWLPLGGYVKMLGQDDLRPNSEAADPRSFNRKSIGARMIVVSAGVIMNVILAGILFMALFSNPHGFQVPPAQVGSLLSDSPAQNTVTVDGKHMPLQVGDTIVDFQGRPQADFTEIGLNVALAPDGTPLPLKVRHLDQTTDDLRITPLKDPITGFLSIGIRPPQELQGLAPKDVDDQETDWKKLNIPDAQAVLPGETITRIDGQPVDPQQFWKLDQALQNAKGQPVRLTVKNDTTGKEDDNRTIQPHFERPFGANELNFAGLLPRPAIEGILPASTARDRLQPGDVILAIAFPRDKQDHPTSDELRDKLNQAGQDGSKIKLTVFRDGKVLPPIADLSAGSKLDKGRRGLGVQLMYDDLHAVVAGVMPGSPADVARIPAGSTITTIDGKSVANWFDVQRILSAATAGKAIAIAYADEHGAAGNRHLTLNQEQITGLKELRRIAPALALREYKYVRKATSLGQAASWGITETRDFILQFYLTLRRMAGGSVSPDQLMGPIGIFTNGAKIGFRGWDWLTWFLAMISANLAVVNFLPIPIVDGGLFTFLILEKIQGRPLSPRTQAIAQYVGLAFLAGVFLFVTYHDILRMWG